MPNRRKIDDCLNVSYDNIYKFRTMQSLSQADLAKRIKTLGVPIHKNDISKIELGERMVKDYELWGIMKALNVHFDDLFVGIEAKLELENDFFN